MGTKKEDDPVLKMCDECLELYGSHLAKCPYCETENMIKENYVRNNYGKNSD